jgi:hypothetical protein
MPAPRSFLLTVHEPGSAVLEDLSNGRHEHVADLAALGAHVARWLEESDRRAGEDPLVKVDGRLRRLDPELVDERTPAREELP